ncbi:MAG: putative manganese-dependent inorganic diphosphatase [Fusobacterium sp.]|uniref:putative manganese-dependent inorganic diphosphatase n=1 Tax=Fusobacterium sp. TaxID=68766 RepID=UPI002A7559E8|nr:putative manganese-dependent inorganic diphosphatase [Fusobacterium sp.]MDY2981450.1 putative manganese-dependent inorganic diphosphatase [Fusobacterium sp.]
MDPILIFGHKHPDTDSICSSIALANLKKELGEEAIPCRLGEINNETRFVLDYFKIDTPKFLKTVSAQISDLTRVEKKVLSVNDSLKGALDTMTEENFSSLPVIDENRQLKGMLHVSDIANTYLNLDHCDLFTKYTTTFENLMNVLKGDIVSGVYPSGIITGNLKSISELDEVSKGDIVVTTYLADGIDRSIKAGAKVIIVSCSEEDFISPRVTSECAIMRVHSNLFKIISLISQSLSVSSIIPKEKFYSFKIDEFLHDIKDIMKEATQTNFPVTKKDGTVYGTIRTKNLINFTRKKVILVDHNEKEQSVDGLQDAKILQVVDHHKFGNFITDEPVKINAEIVGCTSTIIYDLYKAARVVPSKEIAGIMMSAILSDTLLFKSPTCTEKDIEAVRELSKLCGEEDFESFGMKMLIAGTSLKNMTSQEILSIDMKEFTMNGVKISISQINTVDIQGVLEKKKDFEDIMNINNEIHDYSLSLLIITDIIKSGSYFLAIGDKQNLLEKAFDVKLENNIVWLNGIISRKKQVVPVLMVTSQNLD